MEGEGSGRNNRPLLVLLLLGLVILYVLVQNGSFNGLTNLFNVTPGGTPLFSIPSARPIFPTPIGGAFINSTLQPYNGSINGGNQAAGLTNVTPSGGSYAGKTGCVVPNGWVTYTIQSGDTIATIASTYNVPLDQFVAANCLANPDLVYVGQIVFVP